MMGEVNIKQEKERKDLVCACCVRVHVCVYVKVWRKILKVKRESDGGIFEKPSLLSSK